MPGLAYLDNSWIGKNHVEFVQLPTQGERINQIIVIASRELVRETTVDDGEAQGQRVTVGGPSAQ